MQEEDIKLRNLYHNSVLISEPTPMQIFNSHQEQDIKLENPYYDIVRIKAEQSDEEEEEEEESAYDYLSPFLPALVGMQQLTREQALDVREKCLRALKDRLIERANIIQVGGGRGERAKERRDWFGEGKGRKRGRGGRRCFLCREACSA